MTQGVTFGEALEAVKKKAQELLDKIGRGDKITPEDIKGYNSICKAIDKGMDSWLKSIDKVYGNPTSNPEVAQIYNDLVQYRNDLKNEMNCDKVGYLPTKKEYNEVQNEKCTQIWFFVNFGEKLSLTCNYHSLSEK